METLESKRLYGEIMLRIKPILEEDYHFLIDWNEGKGEDYLMQWAGPKAYKHPISVEQIKAHAKDDNSQIYMIFDDENPIGSVELESINGEDLSANINRFIFGEKHKNNGFGALTLKELINTAFYDMGLERLTLRVFCFNVGAIRCYEKAGFLVKEFHQNNDPKWNYYTMEIKK